MRPIRVMFALTSPVRGGVEEVVLALLQRLDPSDFDLSLAAPGPLMESFSAELSRVRVATCDVQAESWLRWSDLRRLAGFMDAIRPDIVNAHLFRSTAVAAPLARLRGVPAVVETYHGREGWRRSFPRGSFLPDRLVSLTVDRVIAVSEAARRFLVRGKGYAAGKIVVVPNGRDLARFRPGAHRAQGRREFGLDETVPLVGVLGRLETQKGHAYLLSAWPRVVAEFPDARLLLLGDGSLRESLERQARDLGVAAHVIFAGFRADVPQMLDTIDVLALPSLYEGMPLTAIEASAMGRAVVATAVDGTPEVVRDGLTGLLVPPADPAALATALARLLRDRPAAERMGRAGRDHVLSRFSLTRQVEATARVYRDVAGSRQLGRYAARVAA
jgi:glycosyltransferase involved in cell wall biosynthesis